MQQGRILPLPQIRARIRVPGADFIGAEFDGRVYRLKYMRGSDVIWIDVDAQHRPDPRPHGRIARSWRWPFRRCYSHIAR